MNKGSMEEKKKIMIKLKKDGKTVREIAEELEVSEGTVYNYTIGIKTIKRKEIEAKQEKVRKLLIQGNTIQDIVEITQISADYVRKLRDAVEYERLARKEELVKGKKTDRQIEVDKINKDHEEKKRREFKGYQEQLEHEKQRLAERFPYAFK